MENMQAQELRKVLAERVRARRKELGLTQRDLAERLGVSQPYVAKIEDSGRNEFPGLDLIARLSEGLQTAPSALLTAEQIFSALPA